MGNLFTGLLVYQTVVFIVKYILDKVIYLHKLHTLGNI